jgi:hypothetical protein
MAISAYPAPIAKRNIVRLTSGTSWTVPAGVTNIVATLVGGGGGGSGSGASSGYTKMHDGLGGQIVSTSLSTTPGASITYAIGAAGSAGSAGASGGGAGGTTTFTGATSATGGNGGSYYAAGATSQQGFIAGNNGTGGMQGGANQNGGAGGAGSIEIEYWSN